MFNKTSSRATTFSSKLKVAAYPITKLVITATLTVVLNLGCGTVERAVDTGMQAVGQTAGERVGEALGDRLAARVNLPAAGTAQWNRFMASQAQVFFNYAISAGGYWPGNVNYTPGEWTRFQIETVDDEGTQYEFERAFLSTAEGDQWWRISAEYDGGSWIYEALIDTTKQQMVRLRAQDPDGNIGEIPVTERTVYHSPQELTEESLEGATTGTEEVIVPAGSFTARRIEFSGMSGSSTVTWWLADDVPGEIVKYQVTQDEEIVWSSNLVEYGSGATTTLDSY